MTDWTWAIGLLLLPFVYVFVRAAYLEIRRYIRYGPAMNNRAAFPMDEEAPSYEAPPQGEGEENEEPEETAQTGRNPERNAPDKGDDHHERRRSDQADRDRE